MIINVSDLLLRLKAFVCDYSLRSCGKWNPEGLRRAMNEVTRLTCRVATWSLTRVAGVLIFDTTSRTANS